MQTQSRLGNAYSFNLHYSKKEKTINSYCRQLDSVFASNVALLDHLRRAAVARQFSLSYREKPTVGSQSLIP